MSDLLHVSALVPATVGVCCTVRDRSRWVELAAGLVMLLAMADLALGAGLLSPLVWAVLLVGGGVGALVQERDLRSWSGLHAAGGLFLMADLAMLMAHHAHVASMTGAEPTDGHDHAHTGVPHAHELAHALVGQGLLGAALVGTVAYLALTVRLSRSRRGAPDAALLGVESGAMGLAVLLMLGAAVSM
jgi:hypothetical protein